MIADKNRDIGQLLADGEAVEAAMEAAVVDALRQHKAAGNRIATWRDGRVVEVEAEAHILPDGPPHA